MLDFWLKLLMTSLTKLIKMLAEFTKETKTDELPKNNSQSLESRFQLINKTKYPEKKRPSNLDFIESMSNLNFKSLGEIPNYRKEMFDSQVAAKKNENEAINRLLNQLAKSRILPPIDPIVEQKQEPEIKEDRIDSLVKTKRRIQIDGEDE